MLESFEKSAICLKKCRTTIFLSYFIVLLKNIMIERTYVFLNKWKYLKIEHISRALFSQCTLVSLSHFPGPFVLV